MPIALGLGVSMVVDLAIGTIAPPVGLGLFVASAITKIPIERLIRVIMPCPIMMLADLVIPTYIPRIITCPPNPLN